MEFTLNKLLKNLEIDSREVAELFESFQKDASKEVTEKFTIEECLNDPTIIHKVLIDIIHKSLKKDTKTRRIISMLASLQVKHILEKFFIESIKSTKTI